MPYMPTLTPQTTPTDRHIAYMESMGIMVGLRDGTDATALYKLEIILSQPLE